MTSTGHEYVGGTRSSGIVSRASGVLGMSVMRGSWWSVSNVYLYGSGRCGKLGVSSNHLGLHMVEPLDDERRMQIEITSILTV